MFGLSDADDALLFPDCSVFELCEEPPDPSVAVNANTVVEAVNELVLMVDRATGEGRVVPAFDFFGLDTSQVVQSDPRVLHDATRSRWLATEISADCAHSYLHVAISATDDPFGSWTTYRLVFTGQVVDFPGLGTSSSTAIVGLNMFKADPAATDCLAPGDYAGASLVVIDWAQLEAAVPSLAVTITDPNASLITYRPAFSLGGDGVGRAVVGIIGRDEDSADVGYSTISGSNATHDVTVSAAVDLTTTQQLAPFRTPPPPRQPDKPATISQAVDGQPTDAISSGSRLWFVSTAPCTPKGDDTTRDCVRLTELTLGTGPTDVGVSNDTVLGERGLDQYMGGVARAIDGTLYLVYSRSSSTEQVATWATSKATSEGAFRAPSLIVPPAGVYSGQRWGDWVILSSDPASIDSVWQTSEVANGVGTWFTWLSQLSPAPIATAAPPTGTFRINGGDQYTNEEVVDLQISNPPDVALTVVRAANDPAVANGLLKDGTTMPVASELPWSMATENSDEPVADGPRIVYLQWGDGQGHWSGVASARITIDMTGPTVGAPTAPRLATGAITGTPAAVPVTVAWPAATDALSGVEEYEVQVTAGPPDQEDDWVGFGQPTTGRSVTDRIPPGQTYHFRVRAYDRVGNVSDWAVGPAARLTLVDDASVALQYSPGWSSHKSKSALRGTYHSTASAGATASLRFSGRSVAIVSSIGPGHGAFDVSIDGQFVRHVVLTAAANLSRRVVFTQTLPTGVHTITITDAGGTPSRIILDGVLTLR
jgi:hypothetical protein